MRRVSPAAYKIVKLAGGVHSVHSVAHRETFHPVIGPVAEAEALYVRQLGLPERMAAHSGEFVIWDVGLGAAANVLTVLRATRSARCPLRIISFDHTLEPLQFALDNAKILGYFDGYEETVAAFLRDGSAQFKDGNRQIHWALCLGDFPSLLADTLTHPHTHSIQSPHAILFDAFSPAKNPAMWTQPLFADLFRLLDLTRPCALPTYSRSTMLRVSLLLAGFYVGAGHATGEKEETTIAANTLALISEPLDAHWLRRARNSTSAEPLWEPIYRQAPLSPETWEKLRAHPQFRAENLRRVAH
jgi:tRNA U34 5-methylaminomethyl-2-thiouridine-forming methyltransferase MnmC